MEDNAPAKPRQPCSGDIYALGTAASVQFSIRPLLFRVIRVESRDTCIGWVWLDGYELNQAGDAVERRSVFVQLAGLRPVGTTKREAPRPVPQGRNQRQMPARPGNGRPVAHRTTTV